MTHAIRIHKVGGPEVLSWEEVDVGRPGPGEVLIRHTAVGVNFVDLYMRRGVYPLSLPGGIGDEAAGVIEAIGDAVADFKPGDRVAYCSAPIGSYAEARVLAASHIVKLPDAVGDQQAAAMMLKGMTAQFLLRQIWRVKPGDTILFHAAAGGVGLIACQWAKHLGATVIGTVGSEAKARLARDHGCDHVIDYSKEDFVQRVFEITGGKKLPVVYDSVGKDTFMKSLDCLAPRGLMVSFGQSSGFVEPFGVNILAAKGSLSVTRPILGHFASTPEKFREMAAELFEVVGSGTVKIEIGQTYPLKDAAKAHAGLEARATTGSTVLVV
jgi:NADPH:quinone reductase